MVIFFFASAAASSAYLTVSETFPLEIRALAIAFFYAVGTGVGGAGSPWLLGALIDTGSRASVAAGYLYWRGADGRCCLRGVALGHCRRAPSARRNLAAARLRRLIDPCCSLR